MESLNTAKGYIEAGDLEEARRELSRILQSEPHHVPAWALLATLLEAPEQRADCYRRILAVDPQNHDAADKLWAINHASAEPSPATEKENSLRCRQCGGTMEVRFEGDRHDKRAGCPYCGTRSDLPDTYSRVIHERRHEEHGGRSRTVDRTVIETRSDHGPDQALRESHIAISESLVQSDEEKTDAPTTLEKLVTFFKGKDGEAGSGEDRLTPEEIVEKAGGPLPVEERRVCPHCQATVSKEASRCQWCGEDLV